MRVYTLTPRHVKPGERIGIDNCVLNDAIVDEALFSESVEGFDPRLTHKPQEREYAVVVSGYTPAILATVKHATLQESLGNWVVVHFLHYNRDNGRYTCQEVIFGH